MIDAANACTVHKNSINTLKCMPLAFFSNLDGGKWREITTFAKYFFRKK